MSYILHDAHVAWWALRNNHRDHKDFKFAVSWPISIRRLKPTYNGAWMVRFQRPRLHFLNAYTVELDYLLARSPDEAPSN